MHYQPHVFSMLKGSKFMLIYVRKTSSMYMLHMLINKMVHVSPLCDLVKTSYTSHVWHVSLTSLLMELQLIPFFETVPFPLRRTWIMKPTQDSTVLRYFMQDSANSDKFARKICCIVHFSSRDGGSAAEVFPKPEQMSLLAGCLMGRYFE